MTRLDPTISILQIVKTEAQRHEIPAEGHTASTWKSCIILGESSCSFPETHKGLIVCSFWRQMTWVQGHLLDVLPWASQFQLLASPSVKRGHDNEGAVKKLK